MCLTPLGFLIPKTSSSILCLVSKQADRSAGDFMLLLKYKGVNSLPVYHLKSPYTFEDLFLCLGVSRKQS